MSAYLSPVFNGQTFIPGGSAPASGYKLFTYVAGSSTKLTTYTNSVGTVQQSNPIILNSAGYPTLGPIWQPAGLLCKYVLAAPNDTDPPTSPVKTVDDVPGVNDPSAAASNQWQPSGFAPTYVTANTFTLPGDQTTNFHTGRRLQFNTTVGTVYGSIRSSAFGILTTTVTMDMDGTTVLDAGLTVVNISIIRSDNSPIGFYRAGTGAAARIAQDKMRDFVSVRDSSTTAVDGTTSNQADIVAAVADAFARGAALYWPPGTYVSTDNIANLHDVEHFGKGIIKRGTDTFAVNPQGKSTQQNKFYISTTGSASNDGLSASEPMATFAQAFTQLTNYDLSAGTWNVIAAAGTYGGSTVSSFTKPSKNRVVVRGPDVGGHPNVPTCIVDGTGGATYSHGLRATESTFVQFQDILFQNFTNATTGTRIGALADVGSDLYTKNVHATNCDWSGVYASDATLRLEGGIIQTCQFGVTSYHSRATVGYNGAAGANRPIIKNCTNCGIYWAKLSMGHIDYCNIEDNPIGVYLDDNARAHGVNNNYKRNDYHVRFETGSRYLDDTDVYNEGTADAATSTTHDIRAYCGEDGEQRFAYSEVRIELDRTGYTHTGTTAKTTISTPYTLPAYRLAWVQSKLRVKVFGTHASVSAGTSVGLDLGATQATLLSVTAAPSAGVGFVAEFEIYPSSATAQRCAGRLDSSGQSPRIVNSGIAADNTAALAVKVTAQLANAADTLTINRIEVFLAG